MYPTLKKGQQTVRVRCEVLCQLATSQTCTVLARFTRTKLVLIIVYHAKKQHLSSKSVQTRPRKKKRDRSHEEARISIFDRISMKGPFTQN